MKKKTIVICASASHYRQVLEIEEKLKKLGFRVVSPQTAYLMKKSGNFDVTQYKTWIKDSRSYNRKKKLMDDHFKEILKGDAVLIVNMEKKGLKGYIGGNVLMEMTAAYLNSKPIYVLNPIDENLSIKEEIYGLFPTFINSNLTLVNRF